MSPSNLTKCCACHEKWHGKISKKISKNRWNVISNAGPIRPWSENDPSMIREWSEHENANRNPPRNRGYFSTSPRAFSIVKYNVSRPILHSNLHQILRLPRKVTLERHQVLRLPRKVTLELHQVLRLPRKVTLELHQILHLPRKMTRLLYRPHIWNVISNARSNRCHYPTSPNTAPATKNDTARCQRKSPKTGETSFPMRGRSDHDPRMIRAWSENDPSMKTQTATRLASEVTFRAHHEHFLLKNTTFRAQSYIQTFTKYCACHVKCHLNFTKYCACHAERLTYLVLIAYETSFTARGATGVTIQPHQILRLPRKMTRLLYRPHIWNVISNARSNRCHHPTSPNTAPATKNDSTVLSSSHMKRHFQCAEQQVSLSNLTKYCACHEKWHCKISKKISKNRWNVISNAGPIRPWSEHDPSMIRAWSDHENANRNPPRKWGYFSSSPRAFSIEKYNVSRPILHSNLHQILRLPRKVPLELHQILRLPRKVTLELHQVLRLPRKVTLELHQVLRLPRKVTLELHQVLHLPRKVTLELHQVLRLPLYCNWTLLYSTVLYSTWLYSTWHYSTWHYSTWHYSTWHYSTWHYSTWLYSTWLYSTWLYSTWLYSTWLYSTWLYSTWLYSTWHYSTWLYSTWLYSTWPYSTWLYSTWLYSTWLYSTWLYSTWLYSTWLYSTWLYSTWHYSTWLYSTWHYSTWLYSTWHYSTWLYSTWLYSTWHYSTWLYSTWLTLLDSTLLDTILLDSTLLDSTLLDSTLLDSTLLDSTLLDSTLLDTILLDSTLLDTTLLDSTLIDTILLDSTLLDSTLLDTILLDSTWLYSTWLTLLDSTLLDTILLDSTLLDSTLLDLTLLRCRSYIGSFWAKLPLISRVDTSRK